MTDEARGTSGPLLETTPDTEDLVEALRDVVNPELGVNVVNLGLIYGVTLEDDKSRPST